MNASATAAPVLVSAESWSELVITGLPKPCHLVQAIVISADAEKAMSVVSDNAAMRGNAEPLTAPLRDVIGFCAVRDAKRLFT